MFYTYSHIKKKYKNGRIFYFSSPLNGIVQTFGILYHCVHICSVSPNETSFEKECSRGYKTVLPRSERKDVDPVLITRPEN